VLAGDALDLDAFRAACHVIVAREVGRLDPALVEAYLRRRPD
jgi:hypothetical protein